jgi:hypothetical protein
MTAGMLSCPVEIQLKNRLLLLYNRVAHQRGLSNLCDPERSASKILVWKRIAPTGLFWNDLDLQSDSHRLGSKPSYILNAWDMPDKQDAG